jgi:hypothetical protein
VRRLFNNRRLEKAMVIAKTANKLVSIGTWMAVTTF